MIEEGGVVWGKDHNEYPDWILLFKKSHCSAGIQFCCWKKVLITCNAILWSWKVLCKSENSFDKFIKNRCITLTTYIMLIVFIVWYQLNFHGLLLNPLDINWCFHNRRCRKEVVSEGQKGETENWSQIFSIWQISKQFKETKLQSQGSRTWQVF